MKIDDVLVPVDFSPTSQNAIVFAIDLMNGQGEIHLLHVVDEGLIDGAVLADLGERDAIVERLKRQADKRLAELVSTHSREGLTIHAVVVLGRPFWEILRLSKELDFQLVVIGTHGGHVESVEQMLFGTTAERVLRGAQVPVLTVPYVPPEP